MRLPDAAPETARLMVQTAGAFLGSLGSRQRRRIIYAVDDDQVARV